MADFDDKKSRIVLGDQLSADWFILNYVNIDELNSSGGDATVYLAVKRSTQQHLALKVMKTMSPRDFDRKRHLMQYIRDVIVEKSSPKLASLACLPRTADPQIHFSHGRGGRGGRGGDGAEVRLGGAGTGTVFPSESRSADYGGSADAIAASAPVISKVDEGYFFTKRILPLEALEGHELLDHINKAANFRTEGENRVRVAVYDVLKGLRELHAHGIVHLDIKPENLRFRDEENQILALIDLDGCTAKSPQNSWPFTTKEKISTTPAYKAPEIRRNGNNEAINISPAADVYSFGVVLYLIFTKGQLPYSEYAEYRPLDARVQQDGGGVPNNQISSQLNDLLRRMLDRNLESRITLDEVLVHPWFTVDKQVLPLVGVPVGLSAVEVQEASQKKLLREDWNTLIQKLRDLRML
jgi:serine/threonine protein kinase